MSYRVFIVGLDGATFDLIHPWVQAGHLPTLARLMQMGAWGELRTTVPPMTGPAWTSFMTGHNPGKHGVFDWIARRPDRYDVVPLSARHRQTPSLWALAGQAGRRVFVFNVPMTYPPEPVNGILIAGLPAPSARPNVAYPTDVYAEITRLVGRYILYPDPGQAYSDSGIDTFLERLDRCTDDRIRILEHFWHKERWDLTMVVFNGTDAVQHALWKYMDPSHPLHDPGRAVRYGDAILQFYRRMDIWLSTVLDSLEDDTVLMVMSDHGAGPFHKFIHVNNWLMHEGFLRLKRTPLAQAKRLLFNTGFTPMQIYNLLMRLGFGVLKREVVRGRGQALLKALFLSFAEVDWRRTQAYSLGNVGQIFINVHGREPLGCVARGAEYERVREAIMAGLTHLRDPDTGEAVIEQVFRREEVYHGRCLDRAPDILFLPRNLEYFGFGEYEFGSNQIIEPVVRGISGTHRMNGILLLAGRPIRSGREIRGAQIVDLAPTILHLLGLTLPEDMDGRVLTEALTAPVRPVSPPAAMPDPNRAGAPSDGDGFTTDEEAAVLDRLRNLGYVG